MSKLVVLLLLTFALADPGRPPATATTADAPAAAGSPVNFIAVDIVIDPHGKPLGCYEAEILASADDATLVGVAGGDAVTFNDPPYYDPRALQGHRIILGAYSLATDLPTRPIHVATLMLRIHGSELPHLVTNLIVAGSSDGKSIAADVRLIPHPPNPRDER